MSVHTSLFILTARFTLTQNNHIIIIEIIGFCSLVVGRSKLPVAIAYSTAGWVVNILQDEAKEL